jgi:aminoglycoside phosphotransferase (APT) family kinase protein
MTHGDLTPGNVLVSAGRLVGVLDVGGLGPADPALDLVGGWHLLEAGPRRVFREELECGDLEWERGKAWALEQATGAVWYYATTNLAMFKMGLRTIDRILGDEPTTR